MAIQNVVVYAGVVGEHYGHDAILLRGALTNRTAHGFIAQEDVEHNPDQRLRQGRELRFASSLGFAGPL
ncbi:MAG: hypothetical protein M3122_09155 [Actinomycetota bacterium]|nr:hypothetical protein [Actinomycetota bacterium]